MRLVVPANNSLCFDDASGTDGKIGHYAGAESKCNCLDRGCDCFEQDHFLASSSKFNTISSVVVSPDGILHIADQANYR